MQQQTMTRNPYFQQIPGSIAHPRAHNIRLTASLPYPSKFSPERSLTVTSFPFSPRTAFEVERPQSHGAPRLVINIQTSFHNKGFLDNTSRKKRVPTFPEIVGERPMTKRRDSRATDTERKSDNKRHPSGSTLYRRSGTATSRRTGSQIIQFEGQDQGRIQGQGLMQNNSNPDIKEMAITERQVRPVQELSAPAPGQTNIPNLGRLTEISKRHSIPISPGSLSIDKHSWISDWISSTSKAMNLDQLNLQEPPISTLSVIDEQ